MTSEDTKNGSYSTTPVNGVPSGLDRVVGTRVFEDVLYSESHLDRVTPGGLFPGERALEIEQNVETARSTVSMNRTRCSFHADP